jgi:murein L,D-transpeptidase YcbB/YkuD
MNRLKKALLSLVIIGSALLLTSSLEAGYISNELKKEILETPPKRLKNQTILTDFYSQYGYRPLWLTDRATKLRKIKHFLDHVRSDVTLDRRGYIHKESVALSKIFRKQVGKKKALKLEFRLTALYYEFLQHTVYGEIEWKNFNAQLKKLKSSKINADWTTYAFRFDIIELMGRENILNTIQEITPKGYRYASLITALKKLRAIQSRGGWKLLTYYKPLKPNQIHNAVIPLRNRLKASGDYKECSAQSAKQTTLFDGCLKKAVQNFQYRHGLTSDGVVGKGTRFTINKSVEKKIEMVLLNIDRIKWLPRESSNRYIVVNIPEYLLHYIENGQELKTFKVIVGDTKHPTPIFSNKISYIVLNPYWKVPEGIVRREVVPHMLKNPNYITKQGLEAHKTWEENSTIMPLDNIVWTDYLQEDKKFPYRLMQPPGPRNALGKIKFKFPNRYSVYLHDTPTKRLFKRRNRAFSHGCVRLSEPRSLLEIISRADANVNLTQSNEILRGKKKTQLNMANKIPIHLIYLTAGVDSKNNLIFRYDIYGYDKYQKRFIR